MLSQKGISLLSMGAGVKSQRLSSCGARYQSYTFFTIAFTNPTQNMNMEDRGQWGHWNTLLWLRGWGWREVYNGDPVLIMWQLDVEHIEILEKVPSVYLTSRKLVVVYHSAAVVRFQTQVRTRAWMDETHCMTAQWFLQYNNGVYNVVPIVHLNNLTIL